MGKALVTDIGSVLDPSTTVFTACTAGSGSTFTVRGTSPQSDATLIDMWTNGATTMSMRVRSPKFADNVQGIRVDSGTELQPFLLDPEFAQPLFPQDSLIVEALGGTTETDTVALQSYYTDLNGADMKLKMPGDLAGQFEYATTWVVDTTASGTIGNYGLTAITHLYDESLANQWYALLGYDVVSELTAVGITGADVSNLNVAGPGSTNKAFTRRYFADLSLKIGKPCIPCFNAANKGNTNVITADDAASTTSHVSLIVAIMPLGWQP